MIPALPILQSELALYYRPRYLAWQNSENGSFWDIAGYQDLFRQWQRKNGLSNLVTINQSQMYGTMIRDDAAANTLPSDYAAKFAAHPEYLTLTNQGEPGTKFCVTEPGLQALAILYAKEWLTAHPGNTTVSMAPSEAMAIGVAAATASMNSIALAIAWCCSPTPSPKRCRPTRPMLAPMSQYWPMAWLRSRRCR